MAALVPDQHKEAAVVRGHRGLDQRPHARVHLLLHLKNVVIDPGLVGSTGFHGGGAARAKDAQGTPTQNHISPSTLVYETTHMNRHALMVLARKPAH